MELTLYLENGETARFNNVNILRDDMEFIIFTYVSMSTGKNKRAKFRTQKIWGFVTSTKEDSK